jgi:hypothetical protein
MNKYNKKKICTGRIHEYGSECQIKKAGNFAGLLKIRTPVILSDKKQFSVFG